MIRFTYKATTVVVTNSEYGSEQLILGVKTKRNMRGKFYTYIRSSTIIIPVIWRLTIPFPQLPFAKMMELRLFYLSTIGKQITYEDADGLIWTGQFINVDVISTTNSRTTGALTLTFEGNHA